MLSKKNFDALALVMRQVDEAIRFKWADPARQYCEWTREITANALADYFEKENPRFDREKFLSASHIDY